MPIKKVIKGAKAYGDMYKGFYDAWKSRKADHDRYVKTYSPKKKK